MFSFEFLSSSLLEWRIWGCFLFLLFLVVDTGDSSSVVPSSLGMTGLGGLFSFEFFSTPIWNDTSNTSSWGMSVSEWREDLELILRVLHDCEVHTGDSSSNPFRVLCRNDGVGWIFFSFEFYFSRPFEIALPNTSSWGAKRREDLQYIIRVLLDCEILTRDSSSLPCGKLCRNDGVRGIVSLLSFLSSSLLKWHGWVFFISTFSP